MPTDRMIHEASKTDKEPCQACKRLEAQSGVTTDKLRAMLDTNLTLIECNHAN